MKKVALIDGNYIESASVLNKIKEHLSDAEVFIFDEQDSFDYISQIVSETSCFGQERLCLVKGFKSDSKNRTKVLNEFKKLFNIIPDGNIIVFYNAGISAKSFFKEVEKYGNIYQFDKKINKDKQR